MTSAIGETPGEPTLDRAVYSACAETMQEDMPLLVGDFIESTEQLITQLSIAESAQDAPAVKMHAHSIKSSAAALGAMRLSKLAAALETLAASGQEAGMADFVTAMRREFTRVRGELSQLAGDSGEL
jgi:HPt (histidine-containing phosphotransfer) domain-containing protein